MTGLRTHNSQMQAGEVKLFYQKHFCKRCIILYYGRHEPDIRFYYLTGTGTE